MFSVKNRIHNTTSTNHEGPSKHYSSPADQLSRKLAAPKVFVRDAGIIKSPWISVLRKNIAIITNSIMYSIKNKIGSFYEFSEICCPEHSNTLKKVKFAILNKTRLSHICYHNLECFPINTQSFGDEIKSRDGDEPNSTFRKRPHLVPI